MSELIVGERYSRNELAEMWGYQGRQPISRGVVTPAGQNLIILFVTQEKQAGMTDYQDRLEGQVLHWEADGIPRNVLRVTRNLRIREDEIHLFFRDTRREDFIYCGELNVVSADPTTTYGTFVLALDPDSAEKVDAARPEERPTPPVAREGAPRPTSVLATFVEAPAPRPVDRPATAHSAEAVDAPSPHDRTAWGWAGTADDFGSCSDPSIVRALADHYRRLNLEEPTSSHFTAWENSVAVVRRAMKRLPVTPPGPFLVFEYELPRERGRRPDLVVLAGPHVVVVEFKDFAEPLHAHVDQVEAYSRDLGEYHQATHDHPVHAVLCLTKGRSALQMDGDTYVVSGEDLSTAIAKSIERPSPASDIDPRQWLESDYAPLPSLVTAARIIFEHEELPHIRRAYSAGIPETLGRLDTIAHEARSLGESHLVLVTGVPGAGKTLVGLQFVYESHFGDDSADQQAVFLSGNGPLVKVLQYTLKSQVFVQDVLGFLRTYGGERTRLPHEHVWVFDEAQRAFDPAMALEKRGKAISEPEDFLRLGSRLESWSMMVGLIGEGQEINRGEEAGIGQWNDALAATDTDWRVHCPNALGPIFTNAAELHLDNCLSLDTNLRAHKAERIHQWVADLLDRGDIASCATLARQLKTEGFELYVTRDIEAARLYVRERYKGNVNSRFGLLASSKARNLYEFGFLNEYQFTKNMRVGPWFADPPESPFSCCALRDTATEFQCQGLELDMPIVGWGHDLWWAGDRWDCSTRYKVQNPRQIRLNAYRVLLTRGRDGFIVFVPPGVKYDVVFEVLSNAGCAALSRTWL